MQSYNESNTSPSAAALGHPGVENDPDVIRQWFASIHRRHQVDVVLRWFATVLAVAGLIVGLGESARAATPDDHTASIFTNGTSNGRYWVVCDPGARAAYVVGYFEASSAVIGTATIIMRTPNVEQNKFNLDTLRDQAGMNPAFTVGDYVHELDALYAATENLPMPLPNAMQWVGAKLAGRRSPEDLERYLRALRSPEAMHGYLEELKAKAGVR
jgi:hypothetical protein